jgi:hypothetical protein
MQTSNFNMLDQLLDYSCRELQLSATNHENAEAHYHAVSDWLAAKDSPLYIFNPVIYPQGSFKIGTTVYPIGNNEHDLDFVCEMEVDWRRTPAVAALDSVERRLRAHATYAPMVERLKRCIRLNYAGAFHMDILPAAPERVRYGTEVLVPDRKLEEWKPSNPKGYADWFEQRGRLLEKVLLKDAHVEPMPSLQSADEKMPLQRAVQLMKRARDRYFVKDPESAPRSIVLTTLVGDAYTRQPSTAQALHDVLASLNDLAGRYPFGIEVRNPANSQEILSEQWIGDASRYAGFRSWLQWLAGEWDKVLSAGSVPAAERQLSVLFGDEIVGAALRKHAADVEILRKSGGLSINRTGTLIAAAGVSSIRPNTFYGK